MSTNRIQKLLFSEYCDFEDMVLVESPFAQTTRDGEGIRQVSLGLTPTKLVLATDILPSAQDCSVKYTPGLDPEIETFELIAIYPVDCLNLSVFHRKRRQSLKAHFCNNRILYFELGGFHKRQMFWNLWCERVKFLNPVEPGSSHSETSVATSTSNSTLYLMATKKIITSKGISQLWCKFGNGGKGQEHSNPRRWTDRHVYLGKNVDESPLNYKPAILPPSFTEFLSKSPSNSSRRLKCAFSLPADYDDRVTENRNKGLKLVKTVSHVGSSMFVSINRFGTGIPENCKSNLLLHDDPNEPNETTYIAPPPQNYTIASWFQSVQATNLGTLEEEAVRIWEYSKKKKTANQQQLNRKHKRRYAIAPQPNFYSGLGPWSVPPGDRVSVQLKRASSLVMVRRQPLEPELRLPLSKRQLVATVSCEMLHVDKLRSNTNTLITTLKRPVIFFWTPEYWYRPCSPQDAYHQVINHLKNVREYCQKNERVKKGFSKRKFFKKNRRRAQNVRVSESEDDSDDCLRRKLRKCKKNETKTFCPLTENFEDQFVKKVMCCFLPNLFYRKERKRKPNETSLEYLKRILRLDVTLTAWDFDSTTLSCQLTLIDRDLFLKIPSLELKVLMSQRCSKNAPNIGALQAFSHRVSCLIATEIIRNDSEKIRARLIARLINAAEKCHKLSNFQSCKSLLNGLQSPAVYRLYATWRYVRKRHATKYQIFENLCRLYRDPRLPAYQKAFMRASEERPFLPYLGDVLARLLSRAPLAKIKPFSKTSMATSDKGKIITTHSTSTSSSGDPNSKKIIHLKSEKTSAPNMIQRFLSSLKIMSSEKYDLQQTLTEYGSEGVFHNPRADNVFEQCKLERLDSAIEFLENGQRAAAAYSLKGHTLARDYLLKARYREERENFMNSFSVEGQYFAEEDGYLIM